MVVLESSVQNLYIASQYIIASFSKTESVVSQSFGAIVVLIRRVFRLLPVQNAVSWLLLGQIQCGVQYPARLTLLHLCFFCVVSFEASALLIPTPPAALASIGMERAPPSTTIPPILMMWGFNSSQMMVSVIQV